MLAATRSALAGASDRRVLGVGVTGMAEALALLGGRGRAVAPAIAWYNGRGEQERDELEQQFGADRFTSLTGLPVSTTASIVKLRWIRRHVPGAAAALCALSVPEYIAHRLGGIRAAELSLASRTGLLDVGRARWATELFEWAGLSDSLFPAALPAGNLLGTVVDPPVGLSQLRGAAIAMGDQDHQVRGGRRSFPRGGAQLLRHRRGLRAERELGACPTWCAAVATSIGVRSHVIPGCPAVLARTPFGLVLAPVYDLFGWEDGPGTANLSILTVPFITTFL